MRNGLRSAPGASPFSFLRRHAQAKRTEDALWSWQQTAEEQEMELAVLRGALVQAQKEDSAARCSRRERRELVEMGAGVSAPHQPAPADNGMRSAPLGPHWPSAKCPHG